MMIASRALLSFKFYSHVLKAQNWVEIGGGGGGTAGFSKITKHLRKKHKIPDRPIMALSVSMP